MVHSLIGLFVYLDPPIRYLDVGCPHWTSCYVGEISPVHPLFLGGTATAFEIDEKWYWSHNVFPRLAAVAGNLWTSAATRELELKSFEKLQVGVVDFVFVFVFLFASPFFLPLTRFTNSLVLLKQCHGSTTQSCQTIRIHLLIASVRPTPTHSSDILPIGSASTPSRQSGHVHCHR